MTDVPSRTFISIKIPALKAVRDIFDELEDVGNIRSPPFDQLHVTLLFLGDVNSKSIPTLCDRVRRALSDTNEFDVVLKDVGTFPRDDRPRIIWIGVEADPLNEIVLKISRELDMMHLDYDRRTFVPHITVGRANGKDDVHDLIERNRNLEFGSFRCTRIDVMESLIGRSGTKHSIIDSVTLAK
ncbi:MAG: RNA 2',3'-cyclic phosphodiesterase [Candidatus Methanomethylophilaceae archaeon]